MKKKLKVSALGVVVALLMLLNVQVAQGHDWWLYCWHKGSTLNVWVFGTNSTQAIAALNDWDSHTDVNFNRVSSHTNISCFGDNFGATGWWGLASIEDTSFDWWHHWWWKVFRWGMGSRPISLLVR